MKSEIFKNESRESSFPFSFSYPVLSKSKLNKNENSKHLKVEKCGTKISILWNSCPIEEF